MRLVSIISILLLQSVYLFSQGIYFNKINSASTGGRGTGIIETDSVYYVLGQMRDSTINNYQKVFLNRYSKFGTLINHSSWGEDYHYYYSGTNASFIKTADNGLIMVGGIMDTVEDYGLIMKFNPSGDTIWTRNYFDTISLTISKFLTFFNIRETVDTGLIIVGQIAASSQTDGDIYLMKTDNLGNIVWYNTYGSTNYIENGVSVIQTPDTGYLIGGNKFNAYDQYSPNGLLVKTDKFGSKQWEMDLGGNLSDGVAFVTMSYDSNYLIGFSFSYQQSNPSFPYREINILKITPSKQVIWDKHFRPHKHHIVLGITELDDNNIVISGYTYRSHSTASGDEGFIMKLNEFGDSLWYRNYYYQPSQIPGAENRFYDFTPTLDGGFIACGSFMNYQQLHPQYIWLVKTDSMGCDTPGCVIVGVKEPQVVWTVGEISIYPNPVSNFINIEINFPFWGSLKFELFDCYGRKVKEAKLTTPSTRISLDFIKDGMYFYIISVKRKIIEKGKFMVIKQ